MLKKSRSMVEILSIIPLVIDALEHLMWLIDCQKGSKNVK